MSAESKDDFSISVVISTLPAGARRASAPHGVACRHAARLHLALLECPHQRAGRVDCRNTSAGTIHLIDGATETVPGSTHPAAMSQQGLRPFASTAPPTISRSVACKPGMDLLSHDKGDGWTSVWPVTGRSWTAARSRPGRGPTYGRISEHRRRPPSRVSTDSHGDCNPKSHERAYIRCWG